MLAVATGGADATLELDSVAALARVAAGFKG